MLLLLCSEWEEVGHIQIKHRQIKILLFVIKSKNCIFAKKSALGWLADISTPQLKSLRILHLEPINVVVSHESTIPNLGVGFVLRCFQRLSLPYIATQQFTWWQS